MSNSIHKKLDEMSEHIVDIKITLGKQQVTLDQQKDSLNEHIRRTDIAEQKLDMLKEEVLRAEDTFVKKQTVKEIAVFLLKLIATLSAIAGTIIAASKAKGMF